MQPSGDVIGFLNAISQLIPEVSRIESVENVDPGARGRAVWTAWKAWKAWTVWTPQPSGTPSAVEAQPQAVQRPQPQIAVSSAGVGPGQ